MDDNALTYDEIQKMVREFTKDSFMETEPYLLLKDIPSELDRERVRIALRGRAKECGFPVKNFDEMAKSVLNDIKRTDNATTESTDTIAKEEGALEGLEHFLNDKPDFGRYLCTNNGIYKVVGQMNIPIKICGHPIFPTKRYVNIETGSELLDVSYKLDGRWKTKKLIDRKTISQNRTIVALSEYGMGVVGCPACRYGTTFSKST